MFVMKSVTAVIILIEFFVMKSVTAVIILIEFYVCNEVSASRPNLKVRKMVSEK